MDYNVAALIVGIFINFLFLCGAINGFAGQIKHQKHIGSDEYAETEGKVVDYRVGPVYSRRSGEKYKFAIYEFIARDGKTYRYCLESLFSTRAKLGDTKTLLYSVDDPTKCEPRRQYTGLVVGVVMIGCIAASIYCATTMGGLVGL
jgi:hypothetical protein